MDVARNNDLRDAYEMAYLLIYATEDHLRATLVLIEPGPLPSFALYTLLRAAADSAVRCAHLLDTGVDETQRLARGMNERLDNLREQAKLDSAKYRSHYDARLANLEQRATANGITVVRQRLKSGQVGEVIGFEEPVKSDLDLFHLYLPAGSTAFRFLSGYVHSKPWVLVPRHKATPSADPKVALVATDLNVGLFLSLLETLLALHDRNIAAWLGLAGYPPQVWMDARKVPD